MLIIASKATIMMLLAIIATAICVIVIAAATVSCNAAKRVPVYEAPAKIDEKGKDEKKG